MVRETRHLWVGNLPENISEERIKEHFKRYGPVQSAKLVSPDSPSDGVCATVAFVDICSAAKAHKADLRLDERGLTSSYYEPSIAQISSSSAASSSNIHLYPPPPVGVKGGGPGPMPGGGQHYVPSSVQQGLGHLSMEARSPRYSGLNEDHLPASSYERSSHFYESRRSIQEEAALVGYGSPVLAGGPPGPGGPPTSVLRRAYPGEREADFGASLRGRIRSYPPRGHFLPNGRAEPGDYRWGGGAPNPQYRYHPESAYIEEKLRRVAGCHPGGSPPPPIQRATPRHARVTMAGGPHAVKRRHQNPHSGSESPSSGHTRSSSSSSSSSSTTSRTSSGSRSGSLGHSSRSPSRSPSRRLGGLAPITQGGLPPLPPLSPSDKRPLAICVKNLPPWSSDNSLKDGLFHDYKKHGKVTTVRIFGSGGERFAVVCFRKPDDAEKALQASINKQFFGVKIQVIPHEGLELDESEFRAYDADLDEYHPKATRTLFIGGLDKDVTAQELRKHFDPFGEIIEIDIKKQNSSTFAFCQYSDIRSVVQAVKSMDGEQLKGNRIKLGFGKSMPNRCIWVGGIAETVTDGLLCDTFSRFGPLTHRHIDREKGHALLAYESERHASSAVTEMRGCVLSGRRLQIDFASRECQVAFYESLNKQEFSSPTERAAWDRRELEKYERSRRDATFVTRPSATQRIQGYSTTRSRARRSYEDYLDDSFERDLHEYAGRQRYENGPSPSPSPSHVSQAPNTPTGPVSVLPPAKHRTGYSPTPSHSPSSRPSLEALSPLRRFDDPPEPRGDRKPPPPPRHRSTSDHDSFHSHSPPPPMPTKVQPQMSPPRTSAKALSPSREVTLIEDRVSLSDPRRRAPSGLRDIVVRVSENRRPSKSPMRHRGSHRTALRPYDDGVFHDDDSQHRMLPMEVIDPRLNPKDDLPSSGDERITMEDRIPKRLKYMGMHQEKGHKRKGSEHSFRPQSPGFRRPHSFEKKGFSVDTKIPTKRSIPEESHKSPQGDPRYRRPSFSGEADESALWRKREGCVNPAETDFFSDESPPGTPVRDEREEPSASEAIISRPFVHHASSSHPNLYHPARERPPVFSHTVPMCLPLPKFAQQIRFHLSPRGRSASPRGGGLMRSPTLTPSGSSSGCGDPPPPLDDLSITDTPVSPGPGPLHSPSSDSEKDELLSPTSSSLNIEERIKALDEKYDRWSVYTRGPHLMQSASREDRMRAPRIGRRKRLLPVEDLRTQEPSNIMKRLLSKRSVFDEDSDRLKNVSDKYEPKPFSSVANGRLCSSLLNGPSPMQVSASILNSTTLPVPSATPLNSLPGMRMSTSLLQTTTPSVSYSSQTSVATLKTAISPITSTHPPSPSLPTSVAHSVIQQSSSVLSPLKSAINLNPQESSLINTSKSFNDELRKTISQLDDSPAEAICDDITKVSPVQENVASKPFDLPSIKEKLCLKPEPMDFEPSSIQIESSPNLKSNSVNIESKTIKDEFVCEDDKSNILVKLSPNRSFNQNSSMDFDPLSPISNISSTHEMVDVKVIPCDSAPSIKTETHYSKEEWNSQNLPTLKQEVKIEEVSNLDSKSEIELKINTDSPIINSSETKSKPSPQIEKSISCKSTDKEPLVSKHSDQVSESLLLKTTFISPLDKMECDQSSAHVSISNHNHVGTSKRRLSAPESPSGTLTSLKQNKEPDLKRQRCEDEKENKVKLDCDQISITSKVERIRSGIKESLLASRTDIKDMKLDVLKELREIEGERRDRVRQKAEGEEDRREIERRKEVEKERNNNKTYNHRISERRESRDSKEDKDARKKDHHHHNERKKDDKCDRRKEDKSEHKTKKRDESKYEHHHSHHGRKEDSTLKDHHISQTKSKDSKEDRSWDRKDYHREESTREKKENEESTKDGRSKVKEEFLKEDKHQKEEKQKEEKPRDERKKEEHIKEDRRKDEKMKEERRREEKFKDEKLKEDRNLDEKLMKEDKVKEERVIREDKVRENYIKDDKVRESHDKCTDEKKNDRQKLNRDKRHSEDSRNREDRIFDKKEKIAKNRDKDKIKEVERIRHKSSSHSEREKREKEHHLSEKSKVKERDRNKDKSRRPSSKHSQERKERKEPTAQVSTDKSYKNKQKATESCTTSVDDPSKGMQLNVKTEMMDIPCVPTEASKPDPESINLKSSLKTMHEAPNNCEIVVAPDPLLKRGVSQSMLNVGGSKLKMPGVEDISDEDCDVGESALISTDEDMLKICAMPAKRTSCRTNSSSSGSRRGRRQAKKLTTETESESDGDSDSSTGGSHSPKKPSYFDVTIYDGNMYDKVKARRVRLMQNREEQDTMRQVSGLKAKSLKERSRKGSRKNSPRTSLTNLLSSEEGEASMDGLKRKASARINSSSEDEGSPISGPKKSSIRSSQTRLSDHSNRHSEESESEIGKNYDSDGMGSTHTNPPRPALFASHARIKDQRLGLYGSDSNFSKDVLTTSEESDLGPLGEKSPMRKPEIPDYRDRVRKEGRMKDIFGLMSDDSDSSIPSMISQHRGIIPSPFQSPQQTSLCSPIRSSFQCPSQNFAKSPIGRNRSKNESYDSEFDEEIHPPTPTLSSPMHPLNISADSDSAKPKEIDEYESKTTTGDVKFEKEVVAEDEIEVKCPSLKHENETKIKDECFNNKQLLKENFLKKQILLEDEILNRKNEILAFNFGSTHIENLKPDLKEEYEAALKQPMKPASLHWSGVVPVKDVVLENLQATDSGKGSSSGVSTGSSCSGSSAEELLLLDSSCQLTTFKEEDASLELETKSPIPRFEATDEDIASKSNFDQETLGKFDIKCVKKPEAKPFISREHRKDKKKKKKHRDKSGSRGHRHSASKKRSALSENRVSIESIDPDPELFTVDHCPTGEDNDECPTVDDKSALEKEPSPPWSKECIEIDSPGEGEGSSNEVMQLTGDVTTLKSPPLDMPLIKPDDSDEEEVDLTSPIMIDTKVHNKDDEEKIEKKFTPVEVSDDDAVPEVGTKQSRTTVSHEETLNAVAGLLACYNEYEDEAAVTDAPEDGVGSSPTQEDSNIGSDEAQKAAQMLQSEMPEGTREQGWLPAATPSHVREEVPEVETIDVSPPTSTSAVSNIPEPIQLDSLQCTPEKVDQFPDSPVSVQSEPALQIDEDLPIEQSETETPTKEKVDSPKIYNKRIESSELELKSVKAETKEFNKVSTTLTESFERNSNWPKVTTIRDDSDISVQTESKTCLEGKDLPEITSTQMSPRSKWSQAKNLTETPKSLIESKKRVVPEIISVIDVAPDIITLEPPPVTKIDNTIEKTKPLTNVPSLQETNTLSNFRAATKLSMLCGKLPKLSESYNKDKNVLLSVDKHDKCSAEEEVIPVEPLSEKMLSDIKLTDSSQSVALSSMMPDILETDLPKPTIKGCLSFDNEQGLSETKHDIVVKEEEEIKVESIEEKDILVENKKVEDIHFKSKDEEDIENEPTLKEEDIKMESKIEDDLKLESKEEGVKMELKTECLEESEESIPENKLNEVEKQDVVIIDHDTKDVEQDNKNIDKNEAVPDLSLSGSVCQVIEPEELVSSPRNNEISIDSMPSVIKATDEKQCLQNMDVNIDQKSSSEIEESWRGSSVRGRSRGRGRRGALRSTSENSSIDLAIQMTTRSSAVSRVRGRGRGRVKTGESVNVEISTATTLTTPEQPRRSTRTKRARKHPDMVDHNEATNRRKKLSRGGAAPASKEIPDDLNKSKDLSSDIYDFKDSDDDDIGSSVLKKNKIEIDPFSIQPEVSPSVDISPIVSRNDDSMSTNESITPRKSRRLRDKTQDDASGLSDTDCISPTQNTAVSTAVPTPKIRGRKKKDVEYEENTPPLPKIHISLSNKTVDSDDGSKQEATVRIVTSINEQPPITKGYTCVATSTSVKLVSSSLQSQPILSVTPVSTVYTPRRTVQPIKLSVVPSGVRCIPAKAPPALHIERPIVSQGVPLLTVSSIAMESLSSSTPKLIVVSSTTSAGRDVRRTEPSVPTPTPLVDPVTGHLTPMKMSEEGHYIPIGGHLAKGGSPASLRMTMEMKDAHKSGKILRAVLPPSITVSAVAVSCTTTLAAHQLSPIVVPIGTAPLVGSQSKVTLIRSVGGAPSLNKTVDVSSLARGGEVSVELVPRTASVRTGVDHSQLSSSHHALHKANISFIPKSIVSQSSAIPAIGTLTSPVTPVSGSPPISKVGVCVLPIASQSHISSFSSTGLSSSSPMRTMSYSTNTVVVQSSSHPALKSSPNQVTARSSPAVLVSHPSNQVVNPNLSSHGGATRLIGISLNVKEQMTAYSKGQPIPHTNVVNSIKSSPIISINSNIHKVGQPIGSPIGAPSPLGPQPVHPLPRGHPGTEYQQPPPAMMHIRGSHSPHNIKPIISASEAQKPHPPHGAITHEYITHRFPINEGVRTPCGSPSSLSPLGRTDRDVRAIAPVPRQPYEMVQHPAAAIRPGGPRVPQPPKPLHYLEHHKGPAAVVSPVGQYMASPPLASPPAVRTPPPAHHHNIPREAHPLKPLGFHRGPYLIQDHRTIYGDKMALAPMAPMPAMPIDLKVIEKADTPEDKESEREYPQHQRGHPASASSVIAIPHEQSSPHHLSSPHYDRTTDSPQVTMMYRRYQYDNVGLYQANRSGTPGMEIENLPRSPVPHPYPPMTPAGEQRGGPPLPDNAAYLLQEYPTMWEGHMILKNDQALVKMHFLAGSMVVARGGLVLPQAQTGPGVIRISQRMRLEQSQLEGVSKKMQTDAEHCVLMALPSGRSHMDMIHNTCSLESGFIRYLGEKKAAGIVNVCAPDSHHSAYVIHIFPPCDFVNSALKEISPDLLNGIVPQSRLMVVIATC